MHLFTLLYKLLFYWKIMMLYIMMLFHTKLNITWIIIITS